MGFIKPYWSLKIIVGMKISTVNRCNTTKYYLGELSSVFCGGGFNNILRSSCRESFSRVRACRRNMLFDRFGTDRPPRDRLSLSLKVDVMEPYWRAFPSVAVSSTGTKGFSWTSSEKKKGGERDPSMTKR